MTPRTNYYFLSLLLSCISISCSEKTMHDELLMCIEDSIIEEIDRSEKTYFPSIDSLLCINFKEIISKYPDTLDLFYSYEVTEEKLIKEFIAYQIWLKLNKSKFSLERDLITYSQNKLKEEQRINILRKKSELNYSRINIGDIVQIRFPVKEENNGLRSSFEYNSPKLWDFNDELDLLLTGVVLHKDLIHIDSIRYFSFRVKSINDTSIKFLMGNIAIGDTLTHKLSIHNSRIEIL